MQMKEKITEAVRQEMSMNAGELADFQKLLEATMAGVRDNKLVMPEERWLGLGLHLVATLRRVKNGETLQAVDQSMLEQVDADMQELSRQVLGAVEATAECQKDATEVLLLAVHFAAAKYS